MKYDGTKWANYSSQKYILLLYFNLYQKLFSPEIKVHANATKSKRRCIMEYESTSV